MNKSVFKQYDDRWRWWVYPKKGWYLNGCGCGCLSVFHCCMELPKYKKHTVVDLMKLVYNFMVKYAVAGGGTYRNGITDGLKHFGFTDVVRFQTRPMSDAFKELKKGSRVGVLLFGSKRGPNGTLWTTGGHYIAFTDYKVQNGKHYFYTKDSGGRNHSGWYCYETSMRGDVIDIWTAKISGGENSEKVAKKSNTTESYKGEFPNIKVSEKKTVNKADKILTSAKELAWAKGTDKNKYAFKGGAPTSAFKKVFDKLYPSHDKWGKGPRKGASCDVFVGTVVRNSGLDKSWPRGFDEAVVRNPKNFTKIVKTKVTPYSASKPGDILLYYKTADHKSKHTLIRGDGCLYEAQYEKTYGHVNSSLSKIKKTMPKVVIFRPKTVSTTVTREYLAKGDSGEEVLKLQKFLNWYGDYKLKEDKSFGPATEAAVKDFQTKEHVALATGKFGKETLEKAKAVKK